MSEGNGVSYVCLQWVRKIERAEKQTFYIGPTFTMPCKNLIQKNAHNKNKIFNQLITTPIDEKKFFF